MSNVWKSIRLDSRIVQSYYKFYIAVYAAAAVVAIIAKIPALAIPIVMVISAPVIGLYFSVYEKNNLSMLYGILPLGRFHVVLGRYLYALGVVVVNGIVAGILAYFVSLFLNVGMSYLEFSAFLSGAFFYFCLFIAVDFPLYFRLPFSKVYVISNLPFYLVGVGGALLLRRFGLLTQLSQISQYFTAHQYLIWVGIGLGVVLLIISCPLAYLMYQRAEL